MAEFTKERIIEELKSSTQNASGMFEISEDTICALMSMLADKPSPAYVPDEIPEPDTARMFFTDAVVAIAKVQGWNACRAAMLHSAEPVSQTYKLNELSGNSPVTPDGWIPVSERMPEPYEYVLVTDGFDGCEVMRVNTDGYWGPAKSLYPGGITHWMPLPEPPQEVNRG
ncbi:DUF551 domain-containing protein [Escherichia coli]|uniref:DUF551 domain-containing protein n=1 Tax=Escherichia coli TaxID=562 RepID=UPI000DE0E267|nr:DUF551 domain-containing protein [Escherichia coli]EKY4415781.1 DUF551 domain-containing protein [Escherichia coli]EKY6958123.1 DUF551 domain-containing protein [Escherichia coli]CAF2537568.1 hypothetical protein AI2860V1_1360 [Escherichia coli]CAH5207529.1 hypothetical protein AI2860V1_1360 [Escherichia coli]HAY0513627.1 DUF551 domain-containing protein [Escherichia coli]